MINQRYQVVCAASGLLSLGFVLILSFSMYLS